VPALIKVDQELLEIGHRRGLDPAEDSQVGSPRTQQPLKPPCCASLRTISTAGKRYAP
jgi:hypothetical protein